MADSDLGGRPLQELAQILVDMLAARAGLLTLWHPEQGQVLNPAGAGLPAAVLEQLATQLTTAAPDLLYALTGARPGVARVGALPGWQLDTARRTAQVSTEWGQMHVLAVPVDGSVALIALVRQGGPADPWATRPHVLRIVVRQLNLALQVREANNRLLTEAAWLDRVLSQASDGLILVDARGHVLASNPAVTHITGWAPTDLAGRSFEAALQARSMNWNTTAAEDDRWPGPLAGEAGIPGEGTAAPLELVLVGRAGNQIYTEARISHVRGPEGTLLGAVVALRDVTAAREAEELQATFLSVISHELQTPLAVIRGYAELLAEGVEQMPPAQLRRKLDIVAEESARLSSMVTSLLDASRIGAGGLELTVEPVDLAHLVARVVQKMEALGNHHQFVVALPEDLPPVLADYARIEQVLLNLLDNAVKYSPAGGRITITSTLTSAEVILSVSDEGIGVPEAERERIFSRFARLNSRVVRQMKGVGLGLFIARAIISAHGGRIWVDVAPGGGAQFSFSLPRQHKAPLPVLFGRG